jgi:cysteinyl-tRNA synthetase
MELKLYDTLAREKRVFTPLDPNNVRMYVCGPTVYDFAHIGNARPVIVFDVLFRLLRHLAKQGVWDGGKGETTVTYVRNITDVDDKINARAAERLAERGEGGAGGGDLNAEIRRLTEETYANFKHDVAALGCLPPTFEPRATEYIRRSDGKLDMITMIERLIASGHAYAADGHVLFHVPSMPDYGRLSKRPLDEMIAGARVEVAPYKRDAMDFVLWKPSAPEEPGWDSPWGRGRPGWHIECSAMSGALLGEVFDIHGGGIDLVFPHHENEIAQSRCAFHTPVMANYWMHNGFLMVEGEKMAKSLGNFITIRELLTSWRGFAWPGSVVRFALLQTHYRQPMDFTEKALDEASMALRGFSVFASDAANISPSEEFLEALADDLNTPRAIAELHRLHKEARDEAMGLAKRMAQPGAMLSDSDRSAARQLAAGLAMMGFEIKGYDQFWRQNQMKANQLKDQTSRIDELIAARAVARKTRNFKEADRIRDELLVMGIALKDGKDPQTDEPVTTWEVAR